MRAFLLLLLIIENLVSFSQKIETKRMDPTRIVVKFQSTAEFLRFQMQNGKEGPIKSVKNTENIPSKRNNSSILDETYFLSVPKNKTPDAYCKEIAQKYNVHYAEPIFAETLLTIPNDPQAQPTGTQYYLSHIMAYEAWDISKSDSTILIGIVDSGIDLLHEDLVNKLYSNDDPLNGIDDDANGYIDDLHGYDFADQDPNAQADGNQHGTHVAGIAAASTNNNTGIAGVGYNAQIVPLKIFKSSNTSSFNAYEAIIYAADNGIDILTLSWGSKNSFSQFNQDVVTYAAVEKDVVLIAAAGNDKTTDLFYPASYEHVLSVAATDENREKASFSSFNYQVDLSAPGQGIYSTQNNSSYGTDNGTSHSVPQVAGVAALLKWKNPEYTAIEIMEKLRTSSDYFYKDPEDKNYTYQLGYGLLNAEKSLQSGPAYSLRIQKFGLDPERPYFGDSISMDITLVNHLDPVFNPKITIKYLENEDPFTHEFASVGYLQKGGVIDLPTIQLPVPSDILPNSDVPLVVEFTDGAYNDFQVISFKTAPNSIMLNSPNMHSTISGTGYWENITYDDTQENKTIVAHIGILAGNSAEFFDHNWSLDLETNTFSDAFDVVTYLKPLLQNIPGIENYGHSKYQILDDSTFVIDQQSFSSYQLPGAIVKYRLANTRIDPLPSTLCSFQIIWDKNLGNSPTVISTNDDKMIVQWDEFTYVGIKIIADSLVAVQSLDSESFNQLIVDAPTDGIWQLATGSLQPNTSQVDISLISTFLDTLQPLQSKEFYSIITVAPTIDEVNTQLSGLTQLVNTIENTPPLLMTLPGCKDGDFLFELHNEYAFYADIHASSHLLISENIEIDNLQNDSVFYVREVYSGTFGPLLRIVVSSNGQFADFAMSSDTLFLGDQKPEQVTFSDLTVNGITQFWDFGNGTQASGVKNPTVLYTAPGLFEITLRSTNSNGCVSEQKRTLVVVKRPPLPNIPEEFLQCIGTTLEIVSNDGEVLRRYLDEVNPSILSQGMRIGLPYFESDTLIYISQVVDGIESLRKKVKITISEVNAAFSVIPLLDSLSSNYVIFSPLDTTNGEFVWEVGENTFGTTHLVWPSNEDSSLFVTLREYGNDGCIVENAQTIKFRKSVTPEITDPEFCIGSDVLIEPKNGNYFGFYYDSLLINPISKGKELLLDSVTADTEIFIVGFDSLLASDILRLHLKPTIFDFSVRADPDTLILSESFSVNFSISENAITYKWYVNDTLRFLGASPVFFFSDTGTYFLYVAATDMNGCIGKASYQLKVIQNRQEDILALENPPIIYPNPTNQSLTINDPSVEQVILTDMSGKSIILQKSQGIFLLRDVKAGVYFVEFQLNAKVRRSKILIER